MSAQAGSAYIAIRPDMSGFHQKIKAELRTLAPEFVRIGRDIGQSIGSGIRSGIGDPLSGPMEESRRRQRQRAPRDGDEIAGAFARSFKTRLEAAFKALPKATINADSSPADRKIAEFRARMEELSKKTVGVDIDAGAAMAELKALKSELASVGRNATINVRADVAAATAELKAVESEVSRLDGRTARVNVDTSGAISGVGMLAASLTGLAGIPVAATLGAGIAALAGPLAAAGAGFGGLAAVALPAITRIKAALAAETQAQQNSTQAAVQGQSRALAMAGAQQTLAAAIRNQGYAHQQALSQVQTAEQQLTQAQVAAGSAQRALTQARIDAKQHLQDLANSVVDAGLAIRQDEINVQQAKAALDQLNASTATAVALKQAEASLAAAQQGQATVAADPQATQATKDAAAARVQQAQAALKSAQAQKAATDLQRKQAQLAYDQAIQQLKEQRLQYQRLTEEQGRAAKAGVEGSNQVVSARERLNQANAAVANSEQQLAKARSDVARADRQAAEQVAAARRGVTSASLSGAAANNQLASSMAKLTPLERGLMSDWKGLTTAFSSWAKALEPQVLPLFTKGIGLLKAGLPSLTPIVKGAAKAVGGLLDDVGRAAKSPFWREFRGQFTALVPGAITGLGKSLGNVITGIAGIIKAFLPSAPSVLSFIQKITAKFADWGKGLGTSNGFAKFMEYVRTNAPKIAKIVADLGVALGHVVTALAGSGGSSLSGFQAIAKALASLSPGQIQGLAAAFIGLHAASAATSGATSLFGKFSEAKSAISDVKDGFSQVKDAISKVGSVASGGAAGVRSLRDGWDTVRLKAMYAGDAVKGAGTKILSAGKTAASAALDLGKLAAGYVLTGLKAAWSAVQLVAVKVAQLAVKAATAAWTAIQWALDAAMNANPIGLIVIAIAALVAGVIYAYTHFTWFKNAVDAAWRGIVAAATWAWNTILKPIFNAIKWYIFTVLIPQYKLLWSVIKQVWSWISSAISWAWNKIIKPIFDLLKWYVGKILVPQLQWLWSIVKTVWNGISAAIKWAWTNVIKPAFDAVKSAMGQVGNAFHTGADAIKSAWNRIKGYTKDPINFVIGTVYNKGIVGMWNQVMSWLHLPKSLQLGKIPLLEAGGAVPVQPGMFNRPTAIVGEGNPSYPEYVIPTDPKYRGRAKGLWAAAGGDLQMLESGGILGGILGGVKKAASSVLHLGADALGLLANPQGIWDKLAAPIINSSKSLAVSPFGNAAAAIGPKVLGEAWTVAKQIISTFASSFGGGGNANAVVAAAKSQLGVPYSWGGGGPGGPSYGFAQGANIRGYDCSSLMQYAYEHGAHKAIPRTTYEQLGVGRAIGSQGQLAPGDLVFPHSGHVMMVAQPGAKGAQGMVEAPHTGANVRMSSFRGMAAGARRIIEHIAGGGGGTPSGGPQSYARSLFGEFGWGGDQFGPLQSLWNRESGWRWNARNPSSGAYGIPQALPPSKMGSAGSDWLTNWATQIRWGLGYIHGRYGSPSGAWAHSQHTGWYDDGGMLQPGLNLAYNATGRPEPVLNHQQWDALTTSSTGDRKVSVMEGATVIVQDPVDADLIAQRNAYAVRAATFG
ncbi:MAG: Metalloendopeptidase-like rane protein [Streptosporangiaceae bacterium]|nr:Metalloendopeptidase-like rane protein [Streptosporangiaceae bacterium]